MRYSWKYWIIIRPPIIKRNRSIAFLTVLVNAAINIPNAITQHARRKDRGNIPINLVGKPIFEIHPFK
jgi:hypothetical protein